VAKTTACLPRRQWVRSCAVAPHGCIIVIARTRAKFSDVRIARKSFRTSVSLRRQDGPQLGPGGRIQVDRLGQYLYNVLRCGVCSLFKFGHGISPLRRRSLTLIRAKGQRRRKVKKEEDSSSGPIADSASSWCRFGRGGQTGSDGSQDIFVQSSGGDPVSGAVWT
jgi:hypothetical protein